MEFVCKVFGFKLILVLGYEYCGVVKVVVDGVELGNIMLMFFKIKLVVEVIEYEGD